MTTTRARASALTLAATALGMSEPLAAQNKSDWALCGAGKYELTAAGQAVGSETFEIVCKPDGHYVATGRTQMSGIASIDLMTKLDIGPDFSPLSASAKGTVQGQPFDQTGTFANGKAMLTSNGQSQTVSYTPGASWLGGNIFYSNVFIAARYDEAKGGAQQFVVFPQVTVTIERVATDGVRLDSGESASYTRFVMRVGPQEIVFWRDADRRLAIVAVPLQKFAATRPESAKWLGVLMANLAKPASSAAPGIDYSAPPGASFTAEEVTIPVATYSLAGTLLVPKGGTRPYAAVVMITGSGLQTRDSRLPLPGLDGYAPFRQIAERLASNGVAVLRVDDRGIGGSTGRETLDNATTSTLAEDTRAQIAWLRARKEIDPRRIVLVGHSEGAAIAAMIGASDPRLAAVVMMAGMGKRGAEVSLEQQEDLLRSDTTLSEAAKAAARVQQREAVKTVLAGGDLPGQKYNAWIREYFAYDPLPTARKIRQPLLILQGERDRQIDQSHAQLLADAVRGAGNRNVTVKVFPTLNHLFLPSTTGSVAEYSHLATTKVPDEVLETLAEWIEKETR